MGHRNAGKSAKNNQQQNGLHFFFTASWRDISASHHLPNPNFWEVLERLPAVKY